MKNIKLIFSGEKCLNAPLMNFLGIQVFRYILARIIYNLKYLFFSKKKNKNLSSTGLNKIQNFLDNETFEKVKLEYYDAINDDEFSKKIIQSGTENIEESVEIKSVDVNDDLKTKYPNLYNLLSNKKINDIFNECEQKNNVKINVNLQQIRVINDKNIDKIKTYHFDTFHNTFKAWLYIDDVSIDDGPFYYLAKSYKFSFERIFIEWIFSIKYCFKSIDASPFFENNKKRKKNYDAEAIKCSDKQNTFIVANTHGLHKRGEAKVNSVRNNIHFYSRENPFKIIFS